MGSRTARHNGHRPRSQNCSAVVAFMWGCFSTSGGGGEKIYFRDCISIMSVGVFQYERGWGRKNMLSRLHFHHERPLFAHDEAERNHAAEGAHNEAEPGQRQWLAHASTGGAAAGTATSTTFSSDTALSTYTYVHGCWWVEKRDVKPTSAEGEGTPAGLRRSRGAAGRGSDRGREAACTPVRQPRALHGPAPFCERGHVSELGDFLQLDNHHAHLTASTLT